MKVISFFIFFISFNHCIAQSIKEYAESFKSKGSVNDYADLLNTEEENDLTKQIDSLKNLSKVEYAVCILEELKGYDKRELATAIGNSWGVGQSDKNNGVLILILKLDKEVFVATGTGTEKYLPNEDVQSIVDIYILPELKNGHFYNGISNGISHIELKLNETNIASSNKANYWKYSILIILIVGLLAYIIYDYKKIGGFDPETKKYSKKRFGNFGGFNGSDTGGGSFGGGGAGGSYGGDGSD
ncbi:MAG: hypothetical protein CMO01_31330 [Thalassobius sp.]|nr:hypothetical protein [Thalassovita sp.]